MSKCMAMLCFLLPITVFAGMIEHTVSVAPGALTTDVINSYDYVSLTRYDHLTQPGYPALPVQYLSFLIPSNARFERLEVVDEQGDFLPGEFDIFPAQKPIPTGMMGIENEHIFTLPDQALYSSPALFPNTTVKYIHQGHLLGYRIVSVLVTPLRYNPALKKLHLTNRLTFRIHYRDGAVRAKQLTAKQRLLGEERVRQLVVNQDKVASFAPPSLAGVNVWKSDYIIITDSLFVREFERLRVWKQKKGVPADIVTTSWIYANYSGVDKAAKVRNFIKAAADSGTMYFLLAGQCDWEVNEEYVPRRDAFAYATHQGGSRDEDTLPCDMYYSDLDGTWDANYNGTYGEETDSVDMYSDVYVGRAPVKDTLQVRNFVSKVIAYETAPALNYVEKALLAVGNVFEGNHGVGFNDTIADTIPDDWQKSKLYEDYGLMSRYIVRDSLNNGFHLANLTGHGNQTGIFYNYGYGGYRYYDHADPGTQTNDSTNAVIVTSNSCWTGAVDKGYWVTNYDCLAERMINTNKSCAVATMMNTRYGWSASIPEGNIQETDEIILWYYRTLVGTNAYHLGEVFALTKDHIAPKALTNVNYRYDLYVFNLFGDPEMPVWTNRPDTLIVTHSPIVYTGTTTFTVTVKNGSGAPLSNALVCCWISKQSPEEYKTQYTDVSGTANFSLSPQNHGDTMFVTVTKRNYVPYAGFALVHRGGPFVAAGRIIVNEPDGDGKVNNGEVINLGVWARNWGNQAANAVVGTLSESDPYVTVNVSSSRYGSKIYPNDSVLSSPYYRFTVANNCPNRHPVAFKLEFRDRRDTVWTSYPRIMVYAPVVIFKGVSVLNDNNHDGYLAPSEMANLAITLKNEGDATAKLVMTRLLCSSPYVVRNDSLASFGNINPGMTATNSTDPLRITLASNTPYNTVLNFSLFVLAGAYSTTLDFTITVVPPDLDLTGTEIVNDDNGYLEIGEIVDLVATLTNKGLATADNVTSVLRTSSPYIRLIDSTGTFGSLPANAIGNNSGDVYTILVDSATPGLTKVDFSIITYSRTYADTFSFSDTVYVPAFTFKDMRVMNDNDGDGALEPGETADIYSVLGNDGVVASDTGTMILRTTSPYITILDSIGTIDPIAPRGVADNAAEPFQVIADSMTPYFSQVDLSVLMTAGLFKDTFDLKFHVGDFPPSDTGYYWAFYKGGPHVQSPPFNWIAIDSTQTQYAAGCLDMHWCCWYWLRLPFRFKFYGKDYDSVVTCTDGAIAFDPRAIIWNMYNSPIPKVDGSRAMVAGVWDLLCAHNHIYQSWPHDGYLFYYYDAPNHRFIIEFYKFHRHRPACEIETFEFILYDPQYYPTTTGDGMIVVQYLNGMLKPTYPWGTVPPEPLDSTVTVGIENERETVGIQYFYNGQYNARALAINDSFVIKYTTDPQGAFPKYPRSAAMALSGREASNNTPLNTLPTQTLLSALQPNPFLKNVRIHYQLAEASVLHLQVYDVTGRVVRTFADGLRNPGYYTEIWDGCDDVGRRVPAGIYFVSFVTDSHREVRKAILLK